MAQQVTLDTVGYGNGVVGDFYDFYVNNTFYLLAPPYYYNLYSNYFKRCLDVYDGWVRGWHNTKQGLVPQRMLQSIARGMNNIVFSNGIDFSGNLQDYVFATKWAKKTKFYTTLKKAHLFAIAGGTSLMKINRKGKELFVTAHRIDNFYPDIDANGNVVGIKVFYDAVHNVTDKNINTHYGICEKRYFNEDGIPCVKTIVYKSGATLQTEISARTNFAPIEVNWENLPYDVRRYIKENHPETVIGKELFLPFKSSLGCFLMRFTEDIPQIPNTPFGQPLGDILWTESFQYDQMKKFEKGEVYLAEGRAILPEQYIDKNDPDYDKNALDTRFFTKVASMGTDNDKITPIQFQLRGEDIRKQNENIFKACAFKTNISASSIASFLSEGAGARTATEIIGERTKTDTWTKGQINLNRGEVDELLSTIMLYYDHLPVNIIFKCEDQAPFIERLKANSDVFSAGNMSTEMFVKLTYKHLSEDEQRKEIEFLNEQRAKAEQQQASYIMGQVPIV